MNNNFYYNDSNNNQPVYSNSQKNLLLIFASIIIIAIGYVMMISGMFDKVSKVETTIDNKIVYQGKDELVKVKVNTNSEFNPVVKFRSKNGKFTVSEDRQEGKEVETKIIAKESGEDILIVEVGRDEGKKDKVEEVKVLICEEPKLLNTTDKTLSIKEETNLQLKFNVDDKCLEGYQIYVENDKVADIDNNYLLNAKKSGKTTLVLKGSKTIKYTLNVRPLKVNVTGVKINTKAFNLAIGKTKSLSVSVKPSDATNKKVTYESSDTNIATVTSSGKVKGINTGVAIITVTSEDNSSKKDTVKVKVYKPAPTVKVTGITFDKTSESMYVGESKSLTTTITPSNATTKTITCKSSNTKIATVKVSGNSCVVKGVKEGNVTITATTKDGSKKATANVVVSKKPTVTVAVTSIKFDKASESVYVGDSKSLATTISPSNATTKTITCKSSNTKIATVSVSSNACVVKGVAAGSVTITATTKDGNKTATITVAVSKKPAKTISVTSVKFEKTSYSVSLNQTVVAAVGVKPSNASNKTITCKSQNTTIATVTYSGNKCTIKGVKVGTTTIEAYSADGNKKTTTQITVKPIAVKGISFENASYSMNIGDSKTLNIKFNPTNASNQVISCASSNNTVATAVSKGASCVVKGVKAGSVTITATSPDGNKTAKTTVKVNTVLVTGVSFATSSYNIDEGNTVTLTPTISPSNATNKGYTCSSNNTGVATITSGCTVKGVSAGTATITVTTSDGGKTSTATVTVKKAVNKVTVTFATFNVGYFACGSYSGASCRPTTTDMVNLIKKYGIDVVGMQEARDTSKNTDPNASCPYTTYKVNSIKNGLGYNGRIVCPGNVDAILSKYKFESSKVYSLGGGRDLTKVVVKINGVDISFYNSHLGLKDDNETHFKKIADIVKSDPNPIIITADWNYTALARFKTYFLDPDDMKFTMAGYDTTSHNMWGKASYCDAILVKSKGHIDIVSSQTVDTYNSYSDHNMVIATLNIY